MFFLFLGLALAILFVKLMPDFYLTRRQNRRLDLSFDEFVDQKFSDEQLKNVRIGAERDLVPNEERESEESIHPNGFNFSGSTAYPERKYKIKVRVER